VCTKTFQYLGFVEVFLEILEGEQIGVILMHNLKEVIVARVQVFNKFVDIKHVQSVMEGPFSEAKIVWSDAELTPAEILA